MVNIVLHAILIQPFEYQGIYMRPSDILLNNQGRMTSAQRLQFRCQRRIYTSLLFGILLATVAASCLVKVTFKARQGFLPA